MSSKMKNWIRKYFIQRRLRGVQRELQYVLDERKTQAQLEDVLTQISNTLRLQLLALDVVSRRPK
jgi:hypothetical protein